MRFFGFRCQLKHSERILVYEWIESRKYKQIKNTSNSYCFDKFIT